MTKKTKAAAAAEAPATSLGAPTTVLTVTLDQLEHDPIAIDGHEKRLSALDDLLASLPVKGQLQSLKVRPSPPSDVHSDYWVTAGNRRLAALRALQARSGAVQGVTVTGDFPVHVIVSDETDADAYESSRSENLQRLPETPVEEFRAFARMAKSKTSREIAGVFGISEKRVEQRLRLAALHDDVLAALEQGKISMEAAQAFTVEPDPAKQAAYLKKNAKNDWALRPTQIKDAFTDDLINGESTIAQIIGREAYLAAGGKMLGDVFDDASYWISPDVVERCLAAHWEKQVAAWKEEGWAFVEPIDTFLPNGGERWKLYHCKHVGADAEDKASAGVVYWPDGDREPEIGIMRYVEPSKTEAAPDLMRLPPDVRATLDGVLGAAVTARLQGDSTLVLRLLVAALRCGQYEPSPVAVTRDYAFAGEDDEEKAKSFSEALAGLDGKSLADLVVDLTDAVIPGMGVMPPFDDEDRAFLLAVNPQVVWDPAPYFGALTKPFLELAWRDMTDPASGEKPPKGKLTELAAKARQRAADTGWLPPQLRTPSYSGPCFVTAVADEDGEAETDEIDDEGAGEADDLNDEDSQLQAAE